MTTTALVLENLDVRPKELAERYGICSQYVRYVRWHARKRGLNVPRMTGNAPTWSEAQIAYLREHYKCDMSAAEIATHLRRSRNAVIGKAHRLGLHQP